MQTSFTTRELANILMVTIQAVHDPAGKEGWPFKKSPIQRAANCEGLFICRVPGMAEKDIGLHAQNGPSEHQ